MNKTYTATVYNKISSFLERNGISDCKILVALSGGADSVTLLNVLYALSEKYSLTLSACHVNHKIRKEAQDDLLFAKKICENLSVPFYEHTFDVPCFAKEKGAGIEEAARIVRYDFFEKLKSELSYDYIATAHNQNDNAETVLFHLIRGSGITGLCGIQEVRKDIIRPLLSVSRQEIEGYISENSLQYVTDSTNSDVKYSRNFIRHEILPLFAKINPDYLSALEKTASVARDYTDFISSLCEKNKTDKISEITKHNSALQAEIIRSLYKDFAGNFPSYESTQKVIEFINSEKQISGKILNFENGVSCMFSGGRIIFQKTDKENHSSFNIILNQGKNIINEDYAVYISKDENTLEESFSSVYKDKEIIYKLYKKSYILSAKINGKLYARNRRAGDTIIFRSHKRKVKELFIDTKIPVHERELVPIICDDEKIIYIPGFPVCDSCKANLCDDAIICAVYKANKRSGLFEEQK